MRIDGRKIAGEIKEEIKTEIAELKGNGIVPKIAIITLGDEGSWEVYVRQKLKVAESLGIKAVLINLEDAKEQRLLATIESIDNDPKYHGIIVQRPLPQYIDRVQVINAISPEKDIDGFRPDSPYQIPLWLAVKKLIETSLAKLYIKKGWGMLHFVVIGKGETAGAPVIAGLKKMGATPTVIDSRTENREQILKKADIVISCVGRENIVKKDDLKQRSVLIGVGIRGEDGKAKGDYQEEGLDSLNGTYTPTPGGVGPVNLSFLFANLLKAAKQVRLKE